LVVFPIERVANRWSNAENLEVYDEPMPLVVEVWSPSTGDYDVDSKLPEYRRRGDLEIWRLHPFERTLTVWRRQPSGGYRKRIYTGGVIRPVAIPDVTIDLDAIFLPNFAT
jgi:Uma2 family endonuclease